MHPKDLRIEDFTYELPADRIAHHPLEQRDLSKLLIYRQGLHEESIYKNLHDYLPEKSLIVFNDTKVIAARIYFKKDTGATIEIFCLEPAGMEKDYVSVMSKTGSSAWMCMIGGAAKWKSGPLKKTISINDTTVDLEVSLIEKLEQAYVAKFSWTPAEFTFAEIIQQAGVIPLPPYIKREAEVADADRYQTVFANYEGSVAAPTAGLHFTKELLENLNKKNILSEYVTLHVGAGTFKPVKAALMKDHYMHAEWMDVRLRTIAHLRDHLDQIVAVGTTATRTLESLYWMGVKSFINPAITVEEIAVKQWEVYDLKINYSISKVDALNSLIKWMENNTLQNIFIKTEIIIAPGYHFKMIDGLITNFHQPGSTLLLLVAAAIGNDWRKLYEYAMSHGFRFLSYGDGSLLFINKELENN